MLYSSSDRDAVAAIRKRRMLVVWIPVILIFLLSVGVFILYRIHHDESGWILSGLLTTLGGAYGIFFYGVYLRPVLKYKQHLDYMLDGRKRVTEGVLKEVSDTVHDREGIDCVSVVINVGEKNDPEDDRLLYLDTFKSMDGFHPGDRIRVESNDRMISAVSRA